MAPSSIKPPSLWGQSNEYRESLRTWWLKVNCLLLVVLQPWDSWVLSIIRCHKVFLSPSSSCNIDCTDKDFMKSTDKTHLALITHISNTVTRLKRKHPQMYERKKVARLSKSTTWKNTNLPWQTATISRQTEHKRCRKK